MKTTTDELIYKVPKLALQVLAGFSVLLSLSFFAFAYYYDSVVPAGPLVIKYVIYVFSLVALAVGIKTFWLPAIVLLKADICGVFFLCPFGQQCDHEFLFVEWCDVNDIELGKVRTGKGVGAAVTIQIKVNNIRAINQYFPESLLTSLDVGDWYTVGISSAFINKKKCLKALSLLKKNYST